MLITNIMILLYKAKKKKEQKKDYHNFLSCKIIQQIAKDYNTHSLTENQNYA